MDLCAQIKGEICAMTETLFFCKGCDCQRDSLVCLLCGESEYFKTEEKKERWTVIEYGYLEQLLCKQCGDKLLKNPLLKEVK